MAEAHAMRYCNCARVRGCVENATHMASAQIVGPDALESNKLQYRISNIEVRAMRFID